MISEFITVGNFEDPFSEFFIEKLHSKSQQEHAVFKLAQDAEKVPVFMADTAEMIFALGSDINLLKLNKQQNSVPDMPDYYKICACPPASDEQQSISQRLQLIEQSSRSLELKFSINELKEASRVQSDLFAW